jgi:putative glutamine amidotransferase
MALTVAISQRVVETTQYAERRDALAHDWPSYVADVLPDSVLLPLPNNPRLIGSWLDAVKPQLIVLSSGNDWGEAPERDQVELRLVDYALAKNVPLFGVCRGLHVINIRFGGEVIRLGPEHGRHVAADHDVIVNGDVFRDMARGSRATVNSYHNLGVTRLAPNAALLPFSATDTGVIEGLVHPDRALLAVQWHPERMSERDTFGTRLLIRLAEQGAFWVKKK